VEVSMTGDGAERKDALDQSAALLYSAWREEQHIDGLAEGIRPLSRAEGYAVQASVAGLIGEPTIGWKIAATSAGGQQHIRVSGPLAGRLFRSRALAETDEVPMGANAMRVAEAEFAFLIGHDLPPLSAEDGLSMEHLLDHVEALHLAIEIPDSRFACFTEAGEAQLIADFACARHFVLGKRVAADWRSMDLAGHALRFLVDDLEVAQGRGEFALGDPRKALHWIAGELGAIGRGLKKGEVILTGTCVVPVPIAPGQRLCADFGTFGTVQARTVA